MDFDYGEFYISKSQAQEFAKAIFADIEDYVNEHLDEFKAFCEQEKSENNVIVAKNNKIA